MRVGRFLLPAVPLNLLWRTRKGSNHKTDSPKLPNRGGQPGFDPVLRAPMRHADWNRAPADVQARGTAQQDLRVRPSRLSRHTEWSRPSGAQRFQPIGAAESLERHEGGLLSGRMRQQRGRSGGVPLWGALKAREPRADAKARVECSSRRPPAGRKDVPRNVVKRVSTTRRPLR